MEEVRPYVAHERDVEIERLGDVVTWRTLLSADRSPTAALTLGVAEIEPSASVEGALHRHPDPEAYYFVAGCGEVHLDGAVHAVEPGSVVFVPGGVRHFVRNTGDETLRLVYAFAVDRFSDVEYEYLDAAGEHPARAVEPHPER